MQIPSDNPSQKSKFKLAHRSYAEALRFIGQTLLKFRPEFLEIELLNDVYHIRGKTPGAIHKSSSRGQKDHVNKSVPPSFDEEAHRAEQSSLQDFTLEYTEQEIAKLSKEWKAKRRDVGKLPDIHGVAELLRTIGSDLDGNGSCLLKITSERQKLVVLFQDRDGNTWTRDYDLVFLSRKQKEIASDRLSRAALIPWKDWDL